MPMKLPKIEGFTKEGVVEVKHLKRLSLAEKILRELKLPKNAAFNMGVWGEHVGAHTPKEKNFCGTSACALGWVCLDPRINTLGLKSVWVKNAYDGEQQDLVPTFKDSDDPIDAAALFFGISTACAKWLFDPGQYTYDPSAKDVAKRMHKLIGGYLKLKWTKTYNKEVEDYRNAVEVIETTRFTNNAGYIFSHCI